MQYGTPYSGCPVCNSPILLPLYNSLNRYILHSLSFHFVLIRFVLRFRVNNEKEKQMRFSYATPREIAIGLKRIWESETWSYSSAQIIEDVY